ncbi:MAG: peptidase M10A/M12B, partial [Bacteroidaceae bacterium]|nr:peptidase M10A/M12B [Bacteroidaceae bacterium]
TRHPNPDVMERNVQKSMVDILITAASESAGVKLNNYITDDPDYMEYAGVAELCGSKDFVTSRPRTLYVTNTQLSRTSDAISVKRGVLVRIRNWAKNRVGDGRTAVQMHFADLVQRIDTALGLKQPNMP